MKNYSITYPDYYIEFVAENKVSTKLLKNILSKTEYYQMSKMFKNVEDFDVFLDKIMSFEINIGYTKWIETYSNSFNQEKEISIFDKGFWKQKDVKFIKCSSDNKNKDFEFLGAVPETLPEDFVVFDVETTGLNTSLDSIIQISAVKYKDSQLHSTLDFIVKPSNKKRITPFITELTGITQDRVDKEGKDFKVVIKDFLDFIEGEILIGHNLKFDIAILTSECKRHKIELQGEKYFDTYLLSKKKLPYLDKGEYKLEKLKNRLPENIKSLESHNALNDCKICAELYLYLKNIGDLNYD